MACGIGVCMTCVLPVIGDDGDHQDASAPASTGRCSAATGSAGTTSGRSRSTRSGAAPGTAMTGRDHDGIGRYAG